MLMPAPLSVDLRQRAVDAVLAGDTTQADVARRFAVSLTAIETWTRRYRATGSVEPTPQRHGPPRMLSADDDAHLAGYLDHDADGTSANDLSLLEIAARFADDTGRQISQTTVFRSLARSGAGSGSGITLEKSRSTPPSA